MKSQKPFFYMVLSVLAVAGLTGCGVSSATPVHRTAQDKGNKTQTSTQAKVPNAPKESNSPNSSNTTAPRHNATPPQLSVNTKTMTLDALDFVSRKVGLAGASGYILRTDNGGHTWDTSYQGPYRVEHFDMVNSLDGYALAVGQTQNQPGVLLATRNGGLSWTKVNVLPDFWSRSYRNRNVHFTSVNDGYVLERVGHSGSGSSRSGGQDSTAGVEWVTTDGGVHWRMEKLPTVVRFRWNNGETSSPASASEVQAVYLDRPSSNTVSLKTALAVSEAFRPGLSTVVSARDIWGTVLGGAGMNQQSYTVFHTDNGGQTWQAVIRSATAGAGPAPGYAGQHPGGFHGTGAEPGPLVALPHGIVYQFGECSACGVRGRITLAKTLDGGVKWTVLSLKLPGQEVVPSFLSPTVGFIAVSTGLPHAPSTLYQTIDGGLHWTTVHTFG
ncbi:MAG: hypothetical protein OWQ59_04505 [Alicyclobacillaceae bacterium]|nr:hypothetical protein [Alicyclobacillaceae bacterium]